MKFKIVPIDSVVPAEYNPRSIKKEALDKLRRSIRELGLLEPIVVNIHPGRENIIVGGHQRVVAAKLEGIKEIPVAFVDLPPDREKLANIALNNLELQGKWDQEKLASVLEGIRTNNEDVTLSGFGEDDVIKMIDEQATLLHAGDENTALAVDPEIKKVFAYNVTCPRCGNHISIERKFEKE